MAADVGFHFEEVARRHLFHVECAVELERAYCIGGIHAVQL